MALSDTIDLIKKDTEEIKKAILNKGGKISDKDGLNKCAEFINKSIGLIDGVKLYRITINNDAYRQKVYDFNTIELSDFQWFLGNSNLGSVFSPRWNMKNGTGSFHSFLRNVSSKTEVDFNNLQVPPAPSSIYALVCNTNITKLDISSWNLDNVSDWDYIFENTKELVEVNFGDWNMSKVKGYSPFYSPPKLTTIKGNLYNLKISLNTSKAPLSKDSALVFINALYDYAADGAKGGNLTFNASTKELLTEEDIAIATSKGWTLA